MKNLIIGLSTISVFFLVSCGSQTTENEPLIQPEPEVVVEEIQAEPQLELSLNDGKHWQANEETTAGINKMIGMMNDFSDTDTEAYQTLSDSLNSAYKLIFKQFTMKGEAHNQLHNYLLPMKKKFAAIVSEDKGESEAAFEDLNAHLLLYADYFE